MAFPDNTPPDSVISLGGDAGVEVMVGLGAPSILLAAFSCEAAPDALISLGGGVGAKVAVGLGAPSKLVCAELASSFNVSQPINPTSATANAAPMITSLRERAGADSGSSSGRVEASRFNEIIFIPAAGRAVPSRR